MNRLVVLLLAALAAGALPAAPAAGKHPGNPILNATRPASSANRPARPPAGSRDAATNPPSRPADGGTPDAAPMKEPPPLNWNEESIENVLNMYGDEIGKTVLVDPNVSKKTTITVKAREGEKLTHEEYLQAIELILEMNAVHLETYGEKFIRAIPRPKVRKDGIPIILDPNYPLGDSGRVLSFLISFENISVGEAQKALEGLKSDTGILLVFERTNAILVTDTEMNIKRMREIAQMIDIATPVTENVTVVQIRYAAATDIKSALEAIVAESQKELEKSGKNASNVPANNGPMPGGRFPGRNLMRKPDAAQPAVVNDSLVLSVSDADRGMIRGKVMILADERSNKLIIVTQDANMQFFKKVIDELDVETTPDTVVKVYRLKYADAEEVSDMINDLIGNSAKSSSSSKQNQNQNAKAGGTKSLTRNSAQPAPKTAANQRSGEAKAGELSKDNTTVLADKRINGLVVMTDKALVSTIEQIIQSMDIKLSQVLIETAIIEVTLGDELKTGVDWVHGLNQSGKVYKQGLAGGGGSANPLVSAATNVVSLLGSALPGTLSTGSAGINYAMISEKLNLSAVVSAAKSDSRSKYLSSPVIMTVDNKEATIDATTARQFVTGWQSTSSGSVYGSGMPTPTYTSKDIGVKVKVKPKINPNGTVMLEVEEEYNQVGGTQNMMVPSDTTYTSQKIDVPTTRKMTSDVILDNMQTVVFGGLVETYTSQSESGIPILKDIPLIGKWLFGSVENTETRTELLIFMTPYVLDDAESAQLEAIRRKRSMSDARPWDDHGWSASELADPVSKKEQLRRLKDEWKKQDAERKTKLAIESEKIKRMQELEKMSKEERDFWLEMHKEELEEEQKESLEEKMLDDEGQDELRKLAAEIREKKLQAAENEMAGESQGE